MSQTDVRGNPCGSGQPAARKAVEQALWRMMSFYDTPLADLDAAAAADPGWALPLVMKAGFLLGLTEPGLTREAHTLLQRAEPLLNQATPREKAHGAATVAVLEGRWGAACRIWEETLLDHPHDVLALQWAHLWDFYRGDAAALRQRPARVLPLWDHQDPLYPHVLSLLAFGLEECNLHDQAEETGRRALALNPRVPWAVHAVAHVMEMQGRYEEGAAWLRQQQLHWAEGNGFAGHLWWHKALFRLEALDCAGVMRLVDGHLAAEHLQITLQRVDAVSMLWRLHLLGQDLTAKFKAVVDGWQLPAAIDQAHGASSLTTLHPVATPGCEAGHYAFNDVHAVLALLGAGDLPRAESWLALCAERALQPQDARRSNHAMAREVGLPLMRGVCALARGEADAATQLMAPALSQSSRLGGSHAQRDLINQCLLAAAAQGHNRKLGLALLNERLMAKPETPLTRYWAEQLSPATGARA